MSETKNKLRTLWLLFLCVSYTLKTIFKVFFLGFLKKPEKIDPELRHWSHNLLKVMKVSIKTQNPENVRLIPGQKYIIMSNHASLMDIPIIFAVFHEKIRMLAKKELFRIPLFGKAMQVAEFPAIDRKNTEQALKDLDVVKQQMQAGIVPWIAPEGTRSRDGALHPFKKGGFMLALQTGASIIPVTIKGAAAIMPPDTFNIHLHQEVEVMIHPPVAAEQFTMATRKEFVREVQQRIAEGLNQ